MNSYVVKISDYFCAPRDRQGYTPHRSGRCNIHVPANYLGRSLASLLQQHWLIYVRSVTTVSPE